MKTYTIMLKDGRKIEFRARGFVRWNLWKLRALRNPFFFSERLSGRGFKTAYIQINTENIFSVEVY